MIVGSMRKDMPTWHVALITGPLSLHIAGELSQQAILPTQLLPQLHDGVHVAAGNGGKDTLV